MLNRNHFTPSIKCLLSESLLGNGQSLTANTSVVSSKSRLNNLLIVKRQVIRDQVAEIRGLFVQPLSTVKIVSPYERTPKVEKYTEDLREVNTF